MIRKHFVLVAFLVVASLWIGTRFNGFFLAQPAQAQAKTTEARKWEYCAVLSVNQSTKKATVAFLTATGTRLETWDVGNGPMPVTFARLGSEGWELIGQVDVSSGHRWRRPKPR